MDRKMFSNGSEDDFFNNKFCCNCRLYVPYEESYEYDSNPKKPSCCPIEYAVAQAAIDGEDSFPDNFIVPDDKGFFYCKVFTKGDHPMLSNVDDIADCWKFKDGER